MLAIFTVLHFLVDGICAAAMAAYAVQEPLLAPIVYYFGLYNAMAGSLIKRKAGYGTRSCLSR